MASPVITVTDVSRHKLSHHSSFDDSLITFTTDKDIIGWCVHFLGVSPTTGTRLEGEFRDVANMRVDSISNTASKSIKDMRCIAQGIPLTTQITVNDINIEGQNRINIYAQDEQGDWTPYE